MEYIVLMAAAAAAAGIWVIAWYIKKMHDEFCMHLTNIKFELGTLRMNVKGVSKQLNSLLEESRSLKFAGDVSAIKRKMDFGENLFDMEDDFQEEFIETIEAEEDFKEILLEAGEIITVSEKEKKQIEAKALLKQGISVNEIAKRLQMATGEVQLIKNFGKNPDNVELTC